MTEAQYMDPERFPLSNRLKSLSLKSQMMIDSINLDELRRLREEGKPLTEAQEAVAKELEDKWAGRPGGPAAS